MDTTLVNPTSESIVIVSSAMNSVSTVASSPVIILDNSILLPHSDQQPDLLQQALAEAALPTSATVANAAVVTDVPLKLPTIQATRKEAKENFVTVFDSPNGTLQLTQENARALGISIHQSNEGKIATWRVSKNDQLIPISFKTVTVGNASTVNVINPAPQLAASQAPARAQVIIEKPMTANDSLNSPAKKVILWPSNHGRASQANVAYLVRPQSIPTPVSVIRPSIIGHHGAGQNTSLITNVLKPVMTTGIYDHHQQQQQQQQLQQQLLLQQQQRKVENIPRIPPIILPKPPVVSVAPTMTNLSKTTNINTSIPSFIVTSTMPAKITTASDPSLFGTTKYPIQLGKNIQGFPSKAGQFLIQEFSF